MRTIRALLCASLLLAAPAAAQTVQPGGGGGAPSGAAGGDLSGTYPNPTLGKIGGLANVAPTVWTPVDGGAGALTLSVNGANYTRIGNMVFAYANITYPANADSTNNAIIGGLPVAGAAAAYSVIPCNITTSSATIVVQGRLANTGTVINLLNGATGALLKNNSLTSISLFLVCIYPAT